MTLFTAMYISGANYPQEWRYLGTFSTEEKAEEYIQTCIGIDRMSFPGHPARYEQHRHAYFIYEVELDEGSWM